MRTLKPASLVCLAAGAAFGLLVSGCSYSGSRALADKAAADALIGTWVSDDKGPFIEKTFERNGIAHGYLTDRRGSDEGRIRFKSRWQVRNGYLVGKVLEVDRDGEVLAPGYAFSDKIIAVTKTEFVFVTEYGVRDRRVRKTMPTASARR